MGGSNDALKGAGMWPCKNSRIFIVCIGISWLQIVQKNLPETRKLRSYEAMQVQSQLKNTLLDVLKRKTIFIILFTLKAAKNVETRL